MTKKRHMSEVAAVLLPSSSLQRYFWFGMKLVVAASIFICVLAFVRISRSSSLEDVNVLPPHLSFSYTPLSFTGAPKIAFLFLARTNIPLDFLWDTFFQNGEEERFSIYVHSSPGFILDDSTTKSRYFYGRQLKRSVQVVWGEESMIEAERLLLGTALEDLANQRFILLSDSCVPLYNFTYVYNYVMSSSKSFVDSFIDPKDKRYNPKMFPTISKDKWRKGSQWITLTRKHVAAVMSDNILLQAFKNHCKRLPRVNLGGKNSKKLHLRSAVLKQHDCIPDEHYVQTLFSMYELNDEVERRTLTYTSWNKSEDELNKEGWHPLTFKFADASPQCIKEIKDINHVYYETEFRTEWCQSNSTSVPCFLFARKFSKAAAMRLLNNGIVGPFDAAKLLSTYL